MTTIREQEAERRRTLIEIITEERKILGQQLIALDATPTPGKTTSAHQRGLNEDGAVKTMGLALSGGGIRAASFALGVLQGLNVRPKPLPNSPPPTEGQEQQPPAVPRGRLLDYVDYLSTVSGGGYAGAAFTYYRHLARQPAPEDACATVDELNLEHFPEPEADVLNRRESRMIDFTRFRRNHLTPGSGLDFNSLIAIALRTVLISWPIYLSAMTLAMMLIYGLAFGIGTVVPSDLTAPLLAVFQDVVPHDPDNVFTGDERVATLGAAIAAGALLTFILNAAWALLRSHDALGMKEHYGLRRRGQRLIGLTLTFALLGLALAVTPLVSSLMYGQLLTALLVGGNAIGGVGLVALKPSTGGNPLISAKHVVTAIAIALLLGNIVLSYEIAELIIVQLTLMVSPALVEGAQPRPVAGVLAGVGMCLFLVLGLRANINYVSLHRMYRDRLMEAFMPDLEAAVTKDNTAPANDADRLFMAKLKRRPLHFVNTNVVLTNSKDSRYRGRAGDSFLLAPHYCGSWATGWKRTPDFSSNPPNDEGMTLATAVAISGAAVNPRVGPSGWTTPLSHPIASAMASFLNLRLGCWVANPSADDQTLRASFFNAGFRGLFNAGFDEHEPLVELTDGGHFENTGIYELLRRRTDIIVFCDASADKQFNFKDLGVAIERARVDLSVDIRFDEDDLDLRHLMPNSAGDELYQQRYEMAKRGYAVGTIHYPALSYTDSNGEVVDLAKREGTFYYLKSVITPGMPGDIYSYRGAFKEFPYQPISDQMFDESQFESYRELGFQVASTMNEEQYKHIDSLLRSHGSARCRQTPATPPSAPGADTATGAEGESA